MSTNTSLKEEIEVLAAMGRTCTLNFHNKQGAELSIRTKIERVFEEEGITYVQAQGGLSLALADLTSIDGKPVENWS